MESLDVSPPDLGQMYPSVSAFLEIPHKVHEARKFPELLDHEFRVIDITSDQVEIFFFSLEQLSDPFLR